jgi:hypothetical protein
MRSWADSGAAVQESTRQTPTHPTRARPPSPPFPQILEAMWDDSVALCLTPQAFSNINPKADIFNNINQQVWGGSRYSGAAAG